MPATHLIAMTLAAGHTAASLAGAVILHVDADALPGGDGTSWVTAYRFPQDALADAAGGGVIEIRVAAGTYLPDRDEANPLGTGNAEATFQLLDGVVLAGGYAGLGEADPDARDLVLYETILSGDLFQNDGPDFAGNAENSFSVVTASFTGPSAVLDGFTITAGHASGPTNGPLHWVFGAGIWNEGGSPTIRDCTITANLARSGGAGMFNYLGAAPDVSGCMFSGNVVDQVALPSAGGAVANYLNGAGNFTGCLFTSNSAREGGAVANQDAAPVYQDCVFEGNTAVIGGAVENFDGGNARIDSCVFTNNAVAIGPDDIGGIGASVHNHSSQPIIVACRFERNTAARYAGGVGNIASSPTIVRCVFKDNTVDLRGGAIWNSDASSPTIATCLFANNEAAFRGGAVFNRIGSSPEIVNCTFAGNTASVGGAAVNSSDAAGGHAAPVLRNCIVWGNGASPIEDVAGAVTTVTYSDVQWGFAGQGNIDADPLFVDPDNGDLRLSVGSPCIDAADNAALPADALDLDGDPRFVDDPCMVDTGLGDPPLVDTGAYEFQDTSCDLDGDGAVGVTDFLSLLGTWGPCPGPCPPSCPADFDGDCTVGVTDFLILLANWG